MEHEKCPYECAHPQTRLTQRRDSLGRSSVVRQCLNCGDSRGAVNKATQPQWFNLPVFDEALRQRWHKLRSDWWEQRRQNYEAGRLAEQMEFWRRYDAHVTQRSPKWQALCRRVRERCKNTCEGCAAALVDHVHHKTYANLGDELLFQLVGLCEACHEKVHGHPIGDR